MMLDGDDWQHAFVLAFWQCKQVARNSVANKKAVKKEHHVKFILTCKLTMPN